MNLAHRFRALTALSIVTLGAASGGLIAFGEPRPLAVVATQPADGAARVPFTTKILLTFSRPVDESSVSAALRVDPPTVGLVSAAGRRVAFTPRSSFRADTDYRLMIGADLRDQSGRPLAQPIVVRFHTEGQGLILRTSDARLLRARLVGAEPEVRTEPLAGPGVGQFAVSPTGDLAYVQLGDGHLVVQPSGSAAPRRIPLPKASGPQFRSSEPSAPIEVRELAWGPGGTLIGFVAARRDGTFLPYLIDLNNAAAPVEPFGLPADQISLNTAPAVAARKKLLLDTLYQHETFAFTPDGRGIIARDRKWNFVVFGFDGALRGTLGPFLGVGNASRRGEFLALVDVDPTDVLLRRQIVAYGRNGRLRSLSLPERDSHSPRFAHRADRVVYATAEAVGPPEARRSALETMDLSSNAHRRLTDPPPGWSDEDPRWSADDAWISFRRAPVGDPGASQVWIVAAEGGVARALPVSATAARWTPLSDPVAVGGRFAPEALEVSGLREVDIGTAQGQPR
jgi:hypothetical protein